ncbi:hypothetical protein MRX96_023039 [Rhipicephalus microplus]
MGGVWERMIGIARRILDSMLLQFHHHRLTHKILTTFMAEFSAIINAWPFIPVSSDPETPVILTPAAIITQKLGCTASGLEYPAIGDLYQSDWHKVKNLASQFWRRWHTAYLITLQRRKWQINRPNLSAGDLALLRQTGRSFSVASRRDREMPA